MTAPHATALLKPTGNVSRFSGRPIATIGNRPAWEVVAERRAKATACPDAPQSSHAGRVPAGKGGDLA